MTGMSRGGRSRGERNPYEAYPDVEQEISFNRRFFMEPPRRRGLRPDDAREGSRGVENIKEDIEEDVEAFIDRYGRDNEVYGSDDEEYEDVEEAQTESRGSPQRREVPIVTETRPPKKKKIKHRVRKEPYQNKYVPKEDTTLFRSKVDAYLPAFMRKGPQATVTLVVQGANNMPAIEDEFGNMPTRFHPYCIVKIFLKGKLFKTVQTKSIAAVRWVTWDKEVKVTVPLDTSLSDIGYQVEMWNHKALWWDDFLGACVFTAHELARTKIGAPIALRLKNTLGMPIHTKSGYSMLLVGLWKC